jgi:hypothetical protein
MQAEYWRLVHELMLHGWYRRGPAIASHAERISWRFREGHVVDRLSERTVQIPASDECIAMRLLLQRVMEQRTARVSQPYRSLAAPANGARP